MLLCGRFSLVAFFSFLRKSNLVSDSQALSLKLLRRRDRTFTDHGAMFPVFATKTIQFTQRSLCIALPFVPRSVLCPVAALHCTCTPGAPLYSVHALCSASFRALTYPQFATFLARSLQAIGADSTRFSPHSFRRGGVTFTFECGIPAELIERQGD